MKTIGRRMFHLLAAALCCSAGVINAVYHSNFEIPYDAHVKRASGSHLIKVGTSFEYGVESSKGFDEDGGTVNAAQIYSPLESARTMLKDPNLLQKFPTSGYSTTDFPEGLDWSTWGAGPLSLETAWGDQRVTANVQQMAMTLWGRVLIDYGTLPGQFFLGMAMPLHSARVDEVTWSDLTDVTADADNQTWKDNLTSKLVAYTKAVGNLAIDGWLKRGLGDTVIYAGWSNSLHQGDGAIRKVDVHASAGLSLPTGSNRDYNNCFSMPFGNDGSWGIPLSAGFSATVGEDVKLGSNLDFLWLASTSKIRRLKTDLDQSDYLILTTGDVTTKPGFTFKANAHATYRCSESCKLSMSYQYIQHEKDTLKAAPTGYDVAVINSLKSLNAWSSQDLKFKVHFEGHFGNDDEDTRDGSEVNLSLFYKMPLAGTRSVANSSVGGELYFSF